VLVAEPAATARARRAVVRATIEHVATAYSPCDDLGDAARRALRDALAGAEVGPGAVAACFAGANGSVDGDACEAGALAAELGPDVPVCAIKGGIGECMGASAVAQLAVAVCALERGVVPPTPGFGALGELAPLHVTTAAEPLAGDSVVVHAWDGRCSAGAALLRSPREPIGGPA
jgi:minimal PKS chain-length factor (CLF/KS beta)